MIYYSLYFIRLFAECACSRRPNAMPDSHMKVTISFCCACQHENDPSKLVTATDSLKLHSWVDKLYSFQVCIISLVPFILPGYIFQVSIFLKTCFSLWVFRRDINESGRVGAPTDRTDDISGTTFEGLVFGVPGP